MNSIGNWISSHRQIRIFVSARTIPLMSQTSQTKNLSHIPKDFFNRNNRPCGCHAQQDFTLVRLAALICHISETLSLHACYRYNTEAMENTSFNQNAGYLPWGGLHNSQSPPDPWAWHLSSRIIISSRCTTQPVALSQTISECTDAWYGSNIEGMGNVSLKKNMGYFPWGGLHNLPTSITGPHVDCWACVMPCLDLYFSSLCVIQRRYRSRIYLFASLSCLDAQHNLALSQITSEPTEAVQ